MSEFFLTVLGFDEEQNVDLKQVSMELTRLALDYGYGTSIGGNVGNPFVEGDPLRDVLKIVESEEKKHHPTISFDLRSSLIDNTADELFITRWPTFLAYLGQLLELPYVASVNLMPFWSGDSDDPQDYRKFETTSEELVHFLRWGR